MNSKTNQICVRPEMSDLYVNPRLTIPEDDIKISFARSSGPGGQNVNKVNSKVTLRWSPGNSRIDPGWRRRFETRYGNRINRDGELVLHSDKYRDQVRNRIDVKSKLVEMLLDCQAAPKARIETRPSRGSQRRRLDAKRRRSEKKQSRRGPRMDD